MIGMALKSTERPCLPLLAGPILLNRLPSGVPAVDIAGDGVDPQLVPIATAVGSRRYPT